ncbi:MAG: STAS domain-containing protein [Fibrobacteria bacterium]|nr:STAS domain-containing protein [Fibrobacteria bacterium]
MNDDNTIDPHSPKIEYLAKDGYTEIAIHAKTFIRDSAREFQAITSEAAGKGESRFLINFKACQYISSEGLGCIAEFWRQCSEHPDKKMVSVFNAEPVNELLNFFEIIGLARVMADHIFTDYDKAVDFLTSN